MPLSRSNGWKIVKLKEGLTVIAVGVAVLTTLAADAQASHGGSSSKKCREPYGRVSNFNTTKATGCSLARRVLDKWWATDDLGGKYHMRMGRDGVLWTCYGNRAYGKMNPWYVSCTSSQTWRKTVWWQYRKDYS